MGGPALQIIDNQGIFQADLIGFILSPRSNLLWFIALLLSARLEHSNHSRPDRSTPYRKGLSKASCRSRVKNEQACFIYCMVMMNLPAGNI